MTRITLAVAAVLAIFVLAACGSSSSDKRTATAPPTPTAVAADDLQKDGQFWVSLTEDLKDELVGLGKEQLGEDRPDGATGIQAVDTAKLVAEIDKQYSNTAKRATTIYSTYTGANDTLAKGDLDNALDGLDQLCNSEPKPPQCG